MMPKAIFVSAILALATGCTYDNGRDNMGGGGGGGGTVDNIAESTIDPGATLAEIEPGKGAGAFVEVSAKGVWHVYTACDTDISGYSCGWDIIVTPLGDNTITAKEGDRLEKADYLGWYGDYSVQMVTDTSYDIDGFFFEANPDKLRDGYSPSKELLIVWAQQIAIELGQTRHIRINTIAPCPIACSAAGVSVAAANSG